MFSKKGELLLELGIKNFSLNDRAYRIKYIGNLVSLHDEYYEKIKNYDKSRFSLIDEIELMNLFIIKRVRNGFFGISPVFKIGRSIYFMLDEEIYNYSCRERMFYYDTISGVYFIVPIFVCDKILENKDNYVLQLYLSNDNVIAEKILTKEMNALTISMSSIIESRMKEFGYWEVSDDTTYREDDYDYEIE